MIEDFAKIPDRLRAIAGTLVRCLEEGNPTLETLLRLTKAVGADLELAITRREVKRF